MRRERCRAADFIRRRNKYENHAQDTVLLLLHHIDLSGAPKVALDAFSSFGDKLDVRTISLVGGSHEDAFRKIGKLTILEKLARPVGYPARIKSRLIRDNISHCLRNWRPDLIYVNSVASLPITTLLRLPDVPVLMHVHELDSIVDFYARRYDSLIRTWPQRYIAVSQAVRKMLVEKYGVSQDALTLINPFVREADFSAPLDQKKQPGDPLVLGGCGHPAWQKGALLWLQVAAEVRSVLGDDQSTLRLGRDK